MTTNPYFNNYFDEDEQGLYDDLIIEMIQMHGVDVIYLPRKLDKINTTFQDVEISSFSDYHTIEMHIETIDGFGGDGDLLAKFGVEIRDQLVMNVSKTRFHTLNIDRPKEGDLLYFPLNQRLFEIKFTEDESLFYDLGKGYVYQLKTELFEYGNQRFSTGIEYIDNLQLDRAYSIKLPLVNGTGDFEIEEWVYCGNSIDDFIAKGRVSEWENGVLKIVDVIGQFDNGCSIVGANSGSIWTFEQTEDYEDMELEFDNVKFADNLDLEKGADEFIDFSENNPFSEENH